MRGWLSHRQIWTDQLCALHYRAISKRDRRSYMQALRDRQVQSYRWCYLRVILLRLPCRFLSARQRRVILPGMRSRPIPKHKRKLRLLQLSTRSAPAIDEAAVVLCVRCWQRHRHSGSSRSDDLHCLQQRSVLYTVDDPVPRLQCRTVRRYGGRGVCVSLYGMR